MKKQGSILIELILVTVILSVSLTVIVYSFLNSLRAMQLTSEYAIAGIILESKMNGLIQQSLLGVRASQDSLMDDGSKYRYELEETEIGEKMENVSLTQKKITAFWKTKGTERSLSLTSYFLDVPLNISREN